METPSDLQLQMLDYFGVSYKSTISKYEASQLIEKLIKETGEEGKQAWFNYRDSIVPANEAEKAVLTFFKVPFSENMTHGEYQVIINKINSNPENEKRFRGSKPIGAKDKEFLDFFKIDFTKGPFYNNEFLSEFESRELKDSLLSVPANKKRWNKHVKELKAKAKLAVTDEQTTVLKFFSKPIPETMTTHEAEELIVSLLTIPKNQERWDIYQEKTEQKELEKKLRLEEKQLIDSLFEYVNDDCEQYESKRVNKKKFTAILEQLLKA